MNQEEYFKDTYLESLPFPMFKTNWYEKRILKKALKETNSKYLCHRIKYGVRPFFDTGLVKKVQAYSEGHLSIKLGTTVEMTYQIDTYELRDIWIRKLLAYKPE